MRRSGTLAATGVLLLSGAGGAGGMVPGGESVAHAQRSLGTVEVEGDRPDDDDDAPRVPGVEDPPFVTIIDARSPSARIVSVADLVEREAGLHVRSRGGLGAFTSVSVRGSDAAEVAIYLDGVPLNRGSGGGVDLSQIPVDGLERVEVYRGVPPVELGADAVGGAINLVTRRGSGRSESLRSSLGAGSFGARSATLGWSGGSARVHQDVSAAYHGAVGDFLYYDNQATQLDVHDDFVARRRNNGFDQVALDATVGGQLRELRWEVGSHGFLKRQGVPGFGSAGAETTATRLDTARLLVDGSVRRSGHGDEPDGRLGAHLSIERTAFTNLLDERAGNFGPSRVEGLTVEGGVDGRTDATLGTHQLLSLLGEARAERFQPANLLDPTLSQPASLRTRAAVALSDEIRLWDDRIALSPAARLDGVNSQLSPGQGTRASQAVGSSRSDVFFSPRLGARARLASGVSLKGSVGRFVRLPSVLELFGDGAFLLPRPSLRPEVALGGDLGLELTGEWRALSGRLELAGFLRSLDDAIVLQPSARGLSALNIGSATVEGVELRARGRLGTPAHGVGTSLEYTFLDAVNHSSEPGAEGKQLPQRARHELAARVDGSAGPYALFYEVHFLDAVYRDAQNYNRLPSRTLHALGVSAGPFARWPVTLTVEVRNLLDLRVVDLPLGGTVHQGQTTPYPLVDVFDYPLPGRAIYATLALRT